VKCSPQTEPLSAMRAAKGPWYQSVSKVSIPRAHTSCSPVAQWAATNAATPSATQSCRRGTLGAGGEATGVAAPTAGRAKRAAAPMPSETRTIAMAPNSPTAPSSCSATVSRDSARTASTSTAGAPLHPGSRRALSAEPA